MLISELVWILANWNMLGSPRCRGDAYGSKSGKCVSIIDCSNFKIYNVVKIKLKKHILRGYYLYVTPNHLDEGKNWPYLNYSKDVLGVFWTFYVRLIYGLCPEGNTLVFCYTTHLYFLFALSFMYSYVQINALFN